MDIALGTDDGVFRATGDGVRQVGLGGKRVTHVAHRGDVTLAAVPGDGVYAGDRRVFEGDARSCAIGPDGALYVGVEPARLRTPAGSISSTQCAKGRTTSSSDAVATETISHSRASPTTPGLRTCGNRLAAGSTVCTIESHTSSPHSGHGPSAERP